MGEPLLARALLLFSGMTNAPPVTLPSGFTDAVALQVGPRSFRLAIETSSLVWNDQHGWVTKHQYVLSHEHKFRAVKEAIDAAEAMREAYHKKLGFQYTRPSGPQNHEIWVQINSKHQERYLCTEGDQPYKLVE